jgi:hypothetical protein
VASATGGTVKNLFLLLQSNSETGSGLTVKKKVAAASMFEKMCFASLYPKASSVPTKARSNE